MTRELLHHFAAVVRTDIVYENADGTLTAYFDNTAGSPLMQNSTLRQSLRNGTAAHARPYMLRDDFNAYYIAHSYREGWLFLVLC